MPAEDLLEMHYRVTEAEGGVFELIAAGRTDEEIAGGYIRIPFTSYYTFPNHLYWCGPY